MTRRRVLAISQNLPQLRRIVSSLERAGAEVDAVRALSAIQSDIIPHRYIFHAVDEGDIDAVEALLPRLRRRAQTAIIVPNAKLDHLNGFLRDRRINHVIAGDELERGVHVTATKLLTGDIFGIEKYLPEGTDVNYMRLRDFKGRGKALDTILAFAEDNGIRRQVRNAIGQVCEELLMNALYDAPVDEEGRQIFAEVDPRDRTKSLSPKPVSIRYAAYDDGFAIAVRDRFGRLAKNTILAYIEKCLHSPVQIDRKTYGAGLGIYLVANAAASYIVNVAYGIATEVVCRFDRTTRAPLRLVGVFVHPGNAEMLTEGPTPESAGAHPQAPATAEDSFDFPLSAPESRES